MRRRGWLLVAGLLCCIGARPALARQRAPIAQSVEAQVLRPADVLTIDATQYLIHELHITNFLTADVTISRIRVRRADAPGTSIAEFEGEGLRAILAKPGFRGSQASEPRLVPGGRAVAYFWIPLPPHAVPISAIVHTIEIGYVRPSGPVQVVFDGGAARVSDEVVLLGPPLRGGPWVAIYDPLLIGGHRTSFYTLDGRARLPGRFAIDWVQLPASGALDTSTTRSADWNGRGAEVLAVADGIVAAALDDIPDNTAEPATAAHTLANASGNYVALDLSGGRFAFYEHLQRGSIAVKQGERVRRGQVIARLGNSGSTSIGPHLHFHMSDANSVLGAEGMPFVFRSFDVLGGFGSIGALVSGQTWAPLERGRTRGGERPAPNAVVRFP